MLLLLLLLTALGVSAHETVGSEDNLGYKCVHNEMLSSGEHKQPRIVTQQYTDFRKRRGNDYQPIRLEINTDFLQPSGDDGYACYEEGASVYVSSGTYTCTSKDVLSASKADYITSQLVIPAREILERALSVIPVQGNYTLSTGNCYSSSLTPLNVPDRYRSPGVPNTDLVIFVTARPVLSNNVLAFAGDCAVDQNRRPIAGFLNLNPSNVDPSTTQHESRLGLILHEMTHVLGFSWGKVNSSEIGGVVYTSFLDEEGKLIPRDEFVDFAMKPGGIPGNSHTVALLKSPKVLQVGREHFGCPTLRGVQLEDQGDSGTAYSHWEKRILYSEYMVGTSYRFPVLSAFTLAYLEDTGWYKANFSAANQFLFGFHQGCSFVEDSCGKWPSHLYFCSNPTHSSCSFDRKSKATCGVRTMIADLPKAYQYFSDPRKGGMDQLADFCPFYNDLNNGWCLEPGSGGLIDSGETYGISSSRCFDTTLARNIPSGDFKQGCYETFCTSSQTLKLKIGEYWYTCPPGENIKAVEYGGHLTCPRNNDLCWGADSTPWPEFGSVTPEEGPPGTPIVIRGSGFSKGMTIIIHGVEAQDCEFKNETEYHCKVPDNQHYRNLKNLLVDKVSIVMVEKGLSKKSTVGFGSFELIIKLNGDWILSMFEWMGDNPLITAAGVAVIFLSCICCGYFVYRERQRALRKA